ncbi:MAG: putative DNA-binding domain-containing protein [Planctomycetes bacterium]|nr:putative DNA-binding domain-containing protein [Planctomycetota bacterium]
MRARGGRARGEPASRKAGLRLPRGGTEAAPVSGTAISAAGDPAGPLRSLSRTAPPRAKLNAVENWMQEVITHPGGIGAGESSSAARSHMDLGAGAIERLIGPSRNLTSRQRLQIYSNMYFWRLIDILAEEYPTVRHVLGPPRFGRLAVAFLTAHPSRSYSLNVLSAGFPDFVRSEAGRLPRRAFLADVARVERTMEEVFDAPDARPLTTKEFRAIPMGRWATGRIRMTPALRLLALDHPVDAFMAAVREERQADVPRRRKEWLAVFRSGYSVWRARLSEERFTLLGALVAGKSLPDAFEACAALRGFDEGRFTAALPVWFKRWASEGFFCGVESAEK